MRTAAISPYSWAKRWREPRRSRVKAIRCCKGNFCAGLGGKVGIEPSTSKTDFSVLGHILTDNSSPESRAPCVVFKETRHLPEALGIAFAIRFCVVHH